MCFPVPGLDRKCQDVIVFTGLENSKLPLLCVFGHVDQAVADLHNAGLQYMRNKWTNSVPPYLDFFYQSRLYWKSDVFKCCQFYEYNFRYGSNLLTSKLHFFTTAIA